MSSCSRRGQVQSISSSAEPDIGPSWSVSKGELRAQIEKLEQVNTKLRAKNREAGREAKLSANRIAELGKQVAQLERRLKPKAAPAESPEKLSRTKTSKQRGPKVVPGGGVLSGASNADDTSLDRDAKTAGEAEAAS